MASQDKEVMQYVFLCGPRLKMVGGVGGLTGGDHVLRDYRLGSIDKEEPLEFTKIVGELRGI